MRFVVPGAGRQASGAGRFSAFVMGRPCSGGRTGNCVVRGARVGLFGMLLLAGSLLSGSASGAELKELRVCADPDNLPFSNQRLEGFENRIAEVIAKELGAEATYYWWPHQRGLVRNTLRADRCDVLIGIPKGFDPVLWTKPYYRTSYVVVYRRDRGFRIGSLDDPALKRVRIGVHTDTPPHAALAERGILNNVVSYPLFFDHRNPNSDERPGKLVADLIEGKVDVAILWGPMAGYFVKKLNASFLELVPLQSDGSIPFAFDISMGVRKGDTALKAALEQALDRRQGEIGKILEDFGVPLMALGTAGSDRGPVAPAEGRKDGPGHQHRE